MTPSASFQGFEDRAHGVLLVVTELSAQSYAKVAQDFAPEQMQAGGMEEISRETIALAAGEGLLVVARQTRKRRRDAQVGAAGAHRRHDGDRDRDAARGRARRLSGCRVARRVRERRRTREAHARRDARRAALSARRPRRVPAAARHSGRHRRHDARAERHDAAGRAALLHGGAARRRTAAAGRARALRAAHDGAFLNRPNVRVVNSEQMRIGGVPGHQIVAAGKDERTGDELVMVQWLRFGPGVVQMFGIARRDQWADVLPRMRAVRDGFRSFRCSW